eukprot:100385-Chlamydomonas_euryale.AAC.13
MSVCCGAPAGCNVPRMQHIMALTMLPAAQAACSWYQGCAGPTCTCSACWSRSSWSTTVNELDKQCVPHIVFHLMQCTAIPCVVGEIAAIQRTRHDHDRLFYFSCLDTDCFSYVTLDRSSLAALSNAHLSLH